MKKLVMFMMALVALVSCEDKMPKNADIRIALKHEGAAYAQADVKVILEDKSGNAIYEAVTDAAGEALFTVPLGLYSASASFKNLNDGEVSLYNGVNSDVVVLAGVADQVYDLELLVSKSSQLVIKELYFGGCQKDDGSGAFSNDCYVILYNNTEMTADASDICFAFTSPSNAHATNKYLADGQLAYAVESWQPAPYAVWWFTSQVIIEPYSQIVVAIKGGIDNTISYSNSVDLSSPDYYYMYHTESGFNLASNYPANPESRPESKLLHTYRYGLGTAWAMSGIDPGFFIFKKNGAEAYAKDVNNYDLTDGEKLPNLKIPFEWIVDGVEVYDQANLEKCNKRFTAAVDGGYVVHTNKIGHSVYRNVDKEATEALAENEGKLVYDYAGGTLDAATGLGSTDPSGIDAEASIANGAHIVYKDTNNSTNDFHERAKASIKK